MAMSEALKRAQGKYLTKLRRVEVRFNMETEEAELFQHISQYGNLQGYIKELIRKDMGNSRVSKNEE